MDKRIFKCSNNPDRFCFVCGHYLFSSDRALKITEAVKHGYEICFKFPLPDQDKSFAPHVICGTCYTNLSKASKGELKSLPFSNPMVWFQQSNHTNDCYFCNFSLHKKDLKNRNKIEYPDVRSAIKPVYERLELSCTPVASTSSCENEDKISDVESDVDDNDDIDYTNEVFPVLLTQAMLSFLIARLGLTKEKAEILASFLNKMNLLAPNTRISCYRTRNNLLRNFFSESEGVTYCNNIPALFSELHINYNPSEWRLFIDSSVSSLKAVLLNNGNNLRPIPIAYTKAKKEEYFSIKNILELVKYRVNKWKVCCDLKMVAILTGLQSGYTRNCCFLCLWNSRQSKDHYTNKVWPKRVKYSQDKETNVVQDALVNAEDVIIPPLHLKLGLMRQFVVTLFKRGGDGCKHLLNYFNKKKSPSKISKGIFTGPDIRKVMKDPSFDKCLSPIELEAWSSIKDVIEYFLGNIRSEDYKEKVERMLKAFEAMGCNMSLKVHFLKSHLDYFPDNLGDLSDEHGEKFHQVISHFEYRYSGIADSAMLSDFCWFVQQEMKQSEDD